MQITNDSNDQSNNARHSRRSQYAWATYDWANSAFASTVMAGFFPIFFKQYWSADTAATTSTFYLGIGNSLASLLIVIAAPVLGALADSGNLKKRMLASFACAGALATIGFFFVAEGLWPLAITLYVIGIIGFSGANVFYDALLVVVSDSNERHRVSALGYALGYLGGGILFSVNVLMTLKPEWFGLADKVAAVKWSFISVAIWWLVFTLPILLFVNEKDAQSENNNTSNKPFATRIKRAFEELKETLGNIRMHRNAAIFLLAYWLYIDGVATIIRMAVDYGLSIGLPSESLIIALILVQAIGFPATLAFGWLAQKTTAKRGLWIGLWVYVAATAYAYFLDSSFEFYFLACVLGLVQGGVQALSRSLFSQLIPEEKSGEFFGFLNMMGKAAAVVGPLLVGVTAHLSGNPRLGILSVLLLFLSGMFLLLFVREPGTSRAARHN